MLYSSFWGVLGSLFILFVLQYICKIISKLPITVSYVFLSVSMIYIIIDTIITTTNIIKVNINLKELERIENDIKRRIKVMNNLRRHNEILRIRQIKRKFNKIGDNIINKVYNLEEGRDIMIELINNKMRRLKKAFPTMKSDKLLKVFNRNHSKDIK